MRIDLNLKAERMPFKNFFLENFGGPFQSFGQNFFKVLGNVSVGVEELDQEKLTPLLRLKHYNSIADAVADLGRPEKIGLFFAGFQKYLYQPHIGR